MNEYQDYGKWNERIARRRAEIQRQLREMWKVPAPVKNTYANWDKNYDSLPEGYHGRWELLSLEDFQFLYQMGIDMD